MVIASLLYIILAQESFHRRALLGDSWGNLSWNSRWHSIFGWLSLELSSLCKILSLPFSPPRKVYITHIPGILFLLLVIQVTEEKERPRSRNKNKTEKQSRACYLNSLSQFPHAAPCLGFCWGTQQIGKWRRRTSRLWEAPGVVELVRSTGTRCGPGFPPALVRPHPWSWLCR